MLDFNVFKKRIFWLIPLIVTVGFLLSSDCGLAEETATTTPEVTSVPVVSTASSTPVELPPPPPPPEIIITNPDMSSPAKTRTIVARSSRGTITFASIPASTSCNGNIPEFFQYPNEEDIVFTDEIDNGARACFRVIDGTGATTYASSETIRGIDTTFPELILKGEEYVTVYLGNSYTDAGATAVDSVDGEVPVYQVGSVDTSVVGIYFIVYSTVDRAGNVASGLTRTIYVREVPLSMPSPSVTNNLNLNNQANPINSVNSNQPVKVVFCSEVTYGDWLPCEGGLQFRDSATKSPDNCFFTAKQQEAKVRGCQAPVVTYCANVFYAKWGPCVNGFQSRVILSQVPEACVVTTHQQSFATKTCSAVLGQKTEVKKYPNGSLLSDSKNIYLIVGGNKYRLKNIKELWAYRKTKTIKVSLDVLSQYPEISSPKDVVKK